MARKSYTLEEAISRLWGVEVLLGQGATIGEASKKIGVIEQAYNRWRKG